jgi:serine/threonine-protein kinase
MTSDVQCAKCGAAITAGARFCMACGNDISGEQDHLPTRVAGKGRPGPKASVTQLVRQNLLQAVRNATLGEYEVLAELGRGGMATVFLAHDLQLDRKVAIKVMSPQLVAGEGMVERFKLEARTAAGLSHPHIIPIYAVRQTDDLLYFVMKFIEGRSLDSIIKQSAPLPVPMVRTIVTKIGEALGYAHRRGVVHRDIKPANIMIDVEGMPIVTDFGIAKVADQQGLTMTGATIGTPTYMSPEQCNAQPITGASDQYSLGVMAYEMLTGRALYDGDSVMTIMFKHVHDEPPLPTALGPHVPLDLAEAVIRMLQKDPGNRWPTVEDALPHVGGSTLAYDDVVRTQMIQFARAGAQREILDRVSTPRSPIPSMAPEVDSAIEEAATVRVSSGQQKKSKERSWPRAAAPPSVTPGPPRSRTRLWIGLAVVAVAGAGATVVLKPWVRAANPVTAAAGEDSTVLGTAPVLQPPAETPPPVARETTTVTAPPPAQAALPAVPVATTLTIAGGGPALDEGALVTLTATVRDQRQQPMRAADVRWESSDPEVATVEGGRVRAVGEGRATITARSGNATADTVVSVLGTVRRVQITPAGPLELPIGQRRQLGITLLGTGDRALGSRPVTWGSSDGAVAEVSLSAGVVTARAAGEATITASAGGAEGSVTIRVPARPVTPPPAEPPAIDPRVALADVVTQYAAALQSKDLSRVLALFPTMPAARAEELRGTLADMEGLRVQLVAENIVIDQNRARARVIGRFTYRERNRDTHLPIDNTYNFERRDGVWTIVSIL